MYVCLYNNHPSSRHLHVHIPPPQPTLTTHPPQPTPFLTPFLTQLADDSLEFCNVEGLITRWVLRAVFTDPSKVPLVGRYLAGWSCTKGKLGTGEAMELVSRPMGAWLDIHAKVCWRGDDAGVDEGGDEGVMRG